jgi:hypothetical protein
MAKASLGKVGHVSQKSWREGTGKWKEQSQRTTKKQKMNDQAGHLGLVEAQNLAIGQAVVFWAQGFGAMSYGLLARSKQQASTIRRSLLVPEHDDRCLKHDSAHCNNEPAWNTRWSPGPLELAVTAVSLHLGSDRSLIGYLA